MTPPRAAATEKARSPIEESVVALTNSADVEPNETVAVTRFLPPGEGHQYCKVLLSPF